jgi:hypothetical protein
MSNQTRKVSYFNTLIFTIIAGIVSLMLLAALFFEVLKPWKVFIITVEIGIFCIIGLCIYQIIANEALLDKYRRASNFNIDFTQCPDYYVSKNINGLNVCSNEYVDQDEYHNKRIMKIYPADDPSKNMMYPLPRIHIPTYANSSNPNEKFDSSYIETATDLKNNEAKCNAILGQNPSYKSFSTLPWEGVKSRCESYAM